MNLIGTSQNRLHPNESRVNKTIPKLDVVICIPIKIKFRISKKPITSLIQYSESSQFSLVSGFIGKLAYDMLQNEAKVLIVGIYRQNTWFVTCVLK